MQDYMVSDSKKSLFIFGVLAAFMNVLPLLLVVGGGDLPFQYALIQCYGQQFWTGDWYPRWCMTANANYGSPMPIFYNVLPYYITSPFYPLSLAGVGTSFIYGIGVFLAAWVTFVGATYWLRSISGNTRSAMVCATVLLWLPYRMELLTTRAAYTELWGFALLPLLFYYVRMHALGERRVWPQIALVLTLCLLCHPVSALMGLIISGIYMLFFMPPFREWVNITAAVLLAFAAAAFHWYPAMKLLHYTGEGSSGGMRKSWANDFADSRHYDAVDFLWGTFEPITWLRSWHVATMVAALLLCMFLSRKGARRELFAYGAVAMLSLALIFSFSAPLWHIIELFTHTIAPWRASMLAVFALAALLALACRYYYSTKLALAAIIISIVTGSAMIQIPKTADPDLRTFIIMSNYIIPYFNTFPHLAARYATDDDAFYQRFAFHRPSELASLEKGGNVAITGWDNNAIMLSAHSTHPDTLFIEQFYFPTWQATVNSQPAELKPADDGTGRMTLTVPAGTSEVVILHDVMSAMPPMFRWVQLASLLSFLVMLVGLLYMRHLPLPNKP